MPKYQCHKTVHALKIKSVESVPTGIGRIYPEDTRYAPFVVPPDFMLKHDPQPGGYYVVYDDGYKSFSPAEAFESGYELVK
jgi:hypothetical protein